MRVDQCVNTQHTFLKGQLIYIYIAMTSWSVQTLKISVGKRKSQNVNGMG